ncbi:MAG TPA: hypothetical protein DHW82_03900 [Spirochaetia bacterium]|nr:MAG: hypothetical protein A2Y41_02515 [Spirochaetes bacterium GWB1_36_13]HCL56137.1 hypothetical protein [Spirochaetia bacterium]
MGKSLDYWKKNKNQKIEKNTDSLEIKNKDIEKASEIQKNFEENLGKLDLSSKEKLVETFPLLWNSEKKFKKHIETRLKYNVIDKNQPKEDYLRKTFETLEKSVNIIYEKPKKNAPRDWHKIIYNKESQWVVIIGENGKIITSFPLNETYKEYLRNQENYYELYSFKKQENDQYKRILKTL